MPNKPPTTAQNQGAEAAKPPGEPQPGLHDTILGMLAPRGGDTKPPADQSPDPNPQPDNDPGSVPGSEDSAGSPPADGDGGQHDDGNASQNGSEHGQEQPGPADNQEGRQPDSTLPKGVQKRIDKLTAKYRAAEEELKTLREKVYQQNQSGHTRGETNSIQELIDRAETPESLEQLEADAIETERWAKKMVSRYRRDPENVEKELERKLGTIPEDPEAWLDDLALNAEFSREQDIPKRREQLAKVQQGRAYAVSQFPWLDDPTDERVAWIEATKNEVPGLKNHFATDYMLALALIGRQTLDAQANQGAKPKITKTPDPTPQPRKPGRSVTPPPRGEVDFAGLKAKAMKSGSRGDMTNLIKGFLKAKA